MSERLGHSVWDRLGNGSVWERLGPTLYPAPEPDADPVPDADQEILVPLGTLRLGPYT